MSVVTVTKSYGTDVTTLIVAGRVTTGTDNSVWLGQILSGPVFSFVLQS